MRNNRAPDFGNRIEKPVVQINDTEADSDELQTAFYGNSDPDFLTIEYDSLFLHGKPRVHTDRADHKQFSMMDLRRVRATMRLDIGSKRNGTLAANWRRNKVAEATSYPPSSVVIDAEPKHQVLM